MIFAKSKFRIKMVILAGLEAILGHLGTILGPLGTLLGRLGVVLVPPTWALLGGPGRSWAGLGSVLGRKIGF